MRSAARCRVAPVWSWHVIAQEPRRLPISAVWHSLVSLVILLAISCGLKCSRLQRSSTRAHTLPQFCCCARFKLGNSCRYAFLPASRAAAVAKMNGRDDYARYLKEHVAPVLSEGMLLALRDQPHDPAAYMAEFLSSKGAATVVSEALKERQIVDEYESLEAEMAELQGQLQAARAEARRRLPVSKPEHLSEDAEAVEAGEVHCAASWRESLRLKKLMRATKVRLGRPLVASDWLLPEGVVLTCSAPFVNASPLCQQLASDFAATFVPASASIGPLAHIAAPADHSLALVERSPDTLLSELAGLAGAPGAPEMLLVFTAPTEVLRRHAQQAGGGDAAMVRTEAWLSETLPALEQQARAAGLSVACVQCDGDVAEQMSGLLSTLVAVY